MEPKINTQKTCLTDLQTQACCLQADDQTREEVPQPAAPTLVVERENVSSPYYHREIF